MEQNTVNYLCPKNTNEFNNQRQNFNGIPNEIINTKRHFFVNPENIILENERGNKKKSTTKNMDKSLNSINMSNIEQKYNYCFLRIGDSITKNQVNLQKILLDYDKDFKGKNYYKIYKNYFRFN